MGRVANQDSRTRVQSATPHRPRLWWHVLGYGLALWLISVAALAITDNTTLVPSVIFLGSFLTPIAATVWLVERQQYTGAAPGGDPSELTPLLLVAGFIGAGVLGVAVSSIVESLIPTPSTAVFYLGVAVIEETVKIAIVWWLARGFTSYHRRDGMVLGACVGLGFAAFETAGYAFTALIQEPDASADSLVTVIGTQVTRALLAPVGHGLWTALLAGALFAAARNSRLRVTWGVLGWWLVVVGLHFVWDEARDVATVLAQRITGPTLGDLDAGPGAAARTLVVTGVLQAVLLGLCALVGLWLARHEWIKGRATVAGFPHGPDDGQPGGSEQ